VAARLGEAPLLLRGGHGLLPRVRRVRAALRADRAYQIAAAHFYAADFEEAERRFEQIAADPDSPWRWLASYLVARCWIRRGTLLPGYGEYDLNALAEAEAQLYRVLANPAASELHAAARRLLGFVDFRLHAQEHLRELSRKLLEPDPPALRQNLNDYTLLMVKHFPGAPYETRAES